MNKRYLHKSLIKLDPIKYRSTWMLQLGFLLDRLFRPVARQQLTWFIYYVVQVLWQVSRIKEIETGFAWGGVGLLKGEVLF